MAAPSATFSPLMPYPIARSSTRDSASTCMILADSLGLVLAVSIMAWAHLEGPLGLYSYLRLVLIVPVFIASFAVSGLYPGIALNRVVELQAIFKSITVSYLFFAAATFFQHDATAYSRVVVFGSWLLSLIFVSVGRFLVRRFCSGTQWWSGTAIVFGTSAGAHVVAEAINRNRSLGLRVVGVLCRESERAHGLATPVLPEIRRGMASARSSGAQYAIIALPGVSAPDVAGIIEGYAAKFRKVLIVPDLAGMSTMGIHARDLGGILGLETKHRLLDPVPQAAKRAFDLLVSTSALLGLTPILLGLWLSIRLTSQGPAFYRQERIGANGKTFYVYKFRSMVSNAHEVLARYLEEHPAIADEWNRNHKLRRDPRVTFVGRFLRKTSIDELPQLFNVLRGEMSLVGPRPIVDQEISKYGRTYKNYIRVRPGLTGLWQVSGRNNTTYDERVAFDQYYVRNWSIWFDMYILARTVTVVMTGHGAY